MIKDFGIFVKNTIKLLTFNIRPLLLFVVIYTAVSGLLVTVITYYLSKLSLFVAGFTYLANDNYVSYLKSPLTWVCFAAGLIAVGLIIMVEISGLIYIYHASRYNRKVRFTEVCYYALDSAKKHARVKNWPVLIYLIIMLPFTGLFSVSNVAFTVAIPEFILDYMMSIPLLKFAYIGFFIFILILTVRWMMSLQSFVLEENTFKEARVRSLQLIKGHFFGAVCTVLLTILIITGILIAGSVMAAGITTLIQHFMFHGGYSSFSDAASIIYLVAIYIYMFCAPAITMAAISSYFYKICKIKQVDIHVKDMMWHKQHPLRKKTIALGMCIACATGSLYVYTYISDNSLTDIVVQRPEIVAHRGDSSRAPENTMPAFELAMREENVDWIELDVRQCADGTVVVSHDDTLYRKTGKNVFIHDSTYDQLKDLDIGAWFSEKYKGTTISTLQDVLTLCKDKMKLQVEIKPASTDQNLVESVADLIMQNDMSDQVVVTSLNRSALEEMKAYEPSIITVYSLAAASGSIQDIDCADWYTIEVRNVTESLVRSIHAKDKKIFVWTVNSEDEVQNLVDMGVDGILTDDPVMLNGELDSADYAGGIGRIIRSLIQNPNFILQFGF